MNDSDAEMKEESKDDLTLSFSHRAIVQFQLKYYPEYLQVGNQIIINEKNLKLCGSIIKVDNTKISKTENEKLNLSS